MSNVVDPTRIEHIVGVRRHPTDHYGRTVTREGIVYILHSQACLDTTDDLRDCPFSLALDEGIDPDEWPPDTPVPLTIEGGRLTPTRTPAPDPAREHADLEAVMQAHVPTYYRLRTEAAYADQEVTGWTLPAAWQPPSGDPHATLLGLPVTFDGDHIVAHLSDDTTLEAPPTRKDDQ